MSTMELLQSFPMRSKNVLSSLDALDPKNSNTITFNLENYKQIVSHQLAFQIAIKVIDIKFHHNVLYEGDSTSVLSMSCCRAISSPELKRSPTTLKSFEYGGFQPHDLLSTLFIELRGNTLYILVEVVNILLDYNLLLGRNSFYDMTMLE